MLARDKNFSLLDPFTSYEKSIVLWICTLVNGVVVYFILKTYKLFIFQLFVFFTTYELAHKARALHDSRLEMRVRAKHSSLLHPFISYEKSIVLWICTLVNGVVVYFTLKSYKLFIFQQFVFFTTYELFQ